MCKYQLYCNCAVPQNIPTLPSEGCWEFRAGRGRGFIKAKTSKGKYEAKLDFPEGWGWGLKPNNLPWRLRDIFWNNRLQKKCLDQICYLY